MKSNKVQLKVEKRAFNPILTEKQFIQMARTFHVLLLVLAYILPIPTTLPTQECIECKVLNVVKREKAEG